MTYNSKTILPLKTREILFKHKLRLKKKLGQNFLIDLDILRKIIEISEINKKINVIEIGPGIGTLTEYLSQSSNQVLAIEIDSRLVSILNHTLRHCKNTSIICKDILKTNLEENINRFFEKNFPIKVVANLPYYITTAILMRLLKLSLPISEMIIMIQKEVADRIAAKPGTKSYGSLSIAVQYYMTITSINTVSRKVFLPQPNVDSVILKLTRKVSREIYVASELEFFKLVRVAFKCRRKTLCNNLKASYGLKSKVFLIPIFKKLGIDLQCRGEELSLEEFVKLSNEIQKSRIIQEKI